MTVSHATGRLPLPVGQSLGAGYRATFRTLPSTMVLVLLVQGAVVVAASPS